MTDRIFADLMTIGTAIVGLAIIAVIVSKNANTANVLTQGGQAFGNIIKEAVSPVSSAGGLPSLSSGSGGF